MRPRRILTPQETAEILDQAVSERALAVVSVQQDDGWQLFKSRFLERDPKRRFFVLDHVETHGTTPVPLVAGQYVGVSFRYRSRKIIFVSVVEARGRFVLEDQSSLPAIRYRWPDTLTELQRRAYHRTPVPPGTCLLATAWPGGLYAREAAQSTPLGILNCEVVDISCGGALLRTTAPLPPDWAEGTTLGIEMHLPDGRPPVMLSAYFRGARADAERGFSIAVQFVGLELSLDGRAALQRLARAVQRFHRLAFSAALRSGADVHPRARRADKDES